MKAKNNPSKVYTVVDTEFVTVEFVGTKAECFTFRNALGEKAYERWRVMEVKYVYSAGYLRGKSEK